MTSYELWFWLLIVVSRSSAEVKLSEFFDFGEAHGDSFLHKNDDEYSSPQMIGFKFKYFNEEQNTIFVNTNGLISFKNGISTFTSEPFPKIGAMTALAPFWSDVDTSGCSLCNISYRESHKPSDLEKATSEIRKYFPVMKHFSAQWTYIVTWYNVPFYGASSEGINKRNTFQAVIISDTDSNFVIYNYYKIEWTTGTSSGGDHHSGTGGIPAQVGFNLGDEFHYYSVEGSRTPSIINLTSLTNVEYPGKFAFRVDLSNIQAGPTPEDIVDPAWCGLDATDIVFVVDLSRSINTSSVISLLINLTSQFPINDLEVQLGVVSFSSDTKVEFYLDSYSNKTDILDHLKSIGEYNYSKYLSSLDKGLTAARQLFNIEHEPRWSHAQRIVMVFTDGLLVETSALLESARILKSIHNAKVYSVGVGSSVKHDLLEHISTNINNVLSPSAEKIWMLLKSQLTHQGCLYCTSNNTGHIYIMLEDSNGMSRKEFEESKDFIYQFLESMESKEDLKDVKISVATFGMDVKEIIALQSLYGIQYQLGRVAQYEYTGWTIDKTILIQHLESQMQSSSPSNKRVFMFITKGDFIDGDFVERMNQNIDDSDTLFISVGLDTCNDEQWDNLEMFATFGYFMFSTTDYNMLARLLPKELDTITCS